MGIEDFTPDEWRKLHELVKEEQEFIVKRKEGLKVGRIKIKQLVLALGNITDSPEHQEQLTELLSKLKSDLAQESDKISKDEEIITVCDNKISRIIDIIGNG